MAPLRGTECARPEFRSNVRGAPSLTEIYAYLERRAREERARAAGCTNLVVAAAFRRRASEFQRRANAELPWDLAGTPPVAE